MNGKEYQVKAMRTNDGLGTERIMNMADNLEQGVEDNVPDTGIDLGGIINGLFGLSGEVGELTKTEYTRLKRSAEKRAYVFEVSIEYLWNLFQEQKQICAITGDYIPNIEEASLDRIDSSKGYIEGNVQWVTYQANLSKHVMTMEQLYEFCRKVLNHANQQPSQRLTTLEGSETN